MRELHPKPIAATVCRATNDFAKHTDKGHGFRRAWAALRFDEGSGVNIKKVHRLWREEGLQVREHHPRERAGISSVPPIEADPPKVVWALDFQFASTIDGWAVKIASMIDERPRIAAARGGTLDPRRESGRRAGEGVHHHGWLASGAADGQRSGDDLPCSVSSRHHPGVGASAAQPETGGHDRLGAFLSSFQHHVRAFSASADIKQLATMGPDEAASLTQARQAAGWSRRGSPQPAKGCPVSLTR